MTDTAFLHKRVQMLREGVGQAEPPFAERMLQDVLQPLFEADGFTLESNQTFNKIDWIAREIAESGTTKIGVEYKHYGDLGRPIGVSIVNEATARSAASSLDRTVLIARPGFTDEAAHLAAQSGPPLQLLTLDDVQAWISRVEAREAEVTDGVRAVVRALAHELALQVARHPSALDAIEWRDLERLVERVLAGLGFRTVLTPPSKDGGKDVIADCELSDGPRSYIIELKHWRSGKEVGEAAVAEFVEVVAHEKRAGGLFLSTSGFTSGAFSTLSEVTRVRYGGRQKIVSLAQRYEKVSTGLWSPPLALPEVLFEFTQAAS